jgi:hypothetical protein
MSIYIAQKWSKLPHEATLASNPNRFKSIIDTLNQNALMADCH